MIDAYNSDTITVNISLDDKCDMNIGETKNFTYDYSSQNNLEYDIEILSEIEFINRI